MKRNQSMRRVGLLLAASGLFVAWTAVTGCRRNADDKGVGTSSVGAGGANGSASNNNQQAEPVKGTDQEDATRPAQGTGRGTETEAADQQKKPGGPAESSAR